MVDLNVLCEDVIKTKAGLQELKLKIEAIIKVMSKEGLLTKEDIDLELSKLLKEDVR